MGTTSESVRKDLARPRKIGKAYWVLGNLIFDGINAKIIAGANQEIIIDAVNNLLSIQGQLISKDASANTILLFDPDTGKFQMKNTSGTVIFEFDSETGNLTINGDIVNTNAEIFSHLSVEHFWTGSSSYVDRTGAFFKIDGDNFNNQTVILEAAMAVEQGGRTAYQRIYNVTDSSVLIEITSTTVGIASPELVRSGALTFPSGQKTYKLQIKQSPAGNGGDNAHFYAARLVHTQT